MGDKAAGLPLRREAQRGDVPALSSRGMSGGGYPKQRNIQKNINADVYVGSRSQVDISHRWLQTAASSVTPRQTAEQGWLCTTPLSARRRHLSLRQTNQSCLSQPFWDTTSQFSSSCLQQERIPAENNPCSRLQQHSSKRVVCKIPHLALSVSPTVNLPQRHSCLEAYNLEGKRRENIDSPQHHHWKGKAADSCSIDTACHRFLEDRNKDSDYLVEKQQHQSPAASCMDPVNPSLVNPHLSSHAVDPPLRHELVVCPSSSCSSESVNACHSSALTLGDLDSLSLESLQTLLQSSQISASLYCAIQRLKQETALMGVSGSLPLEPKSSAVSRSLCFAPDDSPPSILSTREQLAGVKTSVAQARLKWGVPFAKDWSYSAVTRDFSHAEPFSVSHRYGSIDLNTWRTKISGDVQPEALTSRVGSDRLVHTEADPSYNCSSYFRCQSQAKAALETGSLYVHTKSHPPGKVLKGKETSNVATPCAVSWKKDLPASLYPEGLQVSLETDLGGAQMNVGVAMYGTPREVCVRVTSPGDKEFRPVQQLSIKSVEVNNSKPHVKSRKELEQMYDSGSQAARRVAVVGSNQSSPFSVQVEEGFGEYSKIDCVNVSREGRRNKCSQRRRNLEADANLKHSEEPSLEKNAEEPWCGEERSQTQGTVSREVSENSFWSLKVNEQSFQYFCDRQMLSSCFQAWRGHILWKRAAARQLYRQQLLRKGLGALQWAVHQRRMQLEAAQQRHDLALLTVSFHRWKEAVAKRSRKQALKPELCSYTQSSSVGSFGVGVGRLAAMTTSAQHQLTEGYSKEAEQACRVEGGLWTQLHRRQRGDEFCLRAEAIRDIRRLAAAFRLWRLQKELLSKEEARLLEARALLEKQQLRNIFWRWRSRCLEMKQILALTTQIQRNLVSRCFIAWKETVEQKALYRCNLAHLRAVSLRKYFQQWVQMLQVREGDKQAMVNFFLLRWRQHCEPLISSAADKTGTKRQENQRLWTAEKQLPEKTDYFLDDFCQKVKLQRSYLLWKSRLHEHHKADSFSQTLEQCRLRKALKLWQQKCFLLKTTEQSPKHSHRTVDGESLAMLFSEDLSTSSGFDSSASAILASQSSLEKECSFSDSSQQSFSSVLTAEDVTPIPYYSSVLQLHQHAELPAEMGGELYLQAFQPWSTAAGINWFVGGQLQSLALQSPDNHVQSLSNYSAWEEECSSDKKVKSCWHQAEKCFLQRYFIVWSTRTWQLVKAQEYHRLIQLSRAFLSWHHWVMESKNQKAAAALKHQVHCCQKALSLWKKRLVQKVEADQRFQSHIHHLTADALRRWHSCWQRKHAVRELQQQRAQHSCQEKKRLVLQKWYCQTRKQKYAVLFWEHHLLHRCLVGWAQVSACRLKQREALSRFKEVREHRLLVVSFTEWRMKFLRAERQALGERSHKRQEPSQAKACHRWRMASRGRQALCLGSVGAVKQACNYWTKAAAFSQCLRQCSTLIGARKSRKMSLSRSIKSRRGRQNDSAPAASLKLFPSAIHRWLVIYKNQSRAERLQFSHLGERSGVVGPSPVHSRIQDNKTEVDLEEWEEKWLGRKYLRCWHHTVILRQCQRGRRLHCLTRGWHQWKEASKVVALAQMLDQRRLLEKAWRVWRRRHLQSCVVQNFLEEEARSLLSQAFGRWRQLTVFQLKDKGCC